MVTTGEIVFLLRRHFQKVEATFTAADFVHSFGRASQAILCSILYMPEFVEVSGSVLLGWNLPDSDARHRFNSALESKPASREELEASFNFVEVGYIFDSAGRDTDDQEDALLARLLADSWKGLLSLRYPGREFVVEVLPPEQTGSTAGVRFFERR